MTSGAIRRAGPPLVALLVVCASAAGCSGAGVFNKERADVTGRGGRPRPAVPIHSRSRSAFASASVFRSFVNEKAVNELAIDRASTRSRLLFTTPSSVTWPFSTMT